jgi:hypothetical protein
MNSAKSKVQVPARAITGRELVELHLKKYIAESGFKATAAEAGIGINMLWKILHGQRQVSPGLAELLGFKAKNLRLYSPIKGGK